MSAESIPTWTPEELWTFNDKLIEQGRLHCVWIGAVWDEIETHELWKARGYETYTACVEKEGPRAYSTVMECVRNYRFFVLGDRMAFPEYLTLVVKQGIYKVSVIRQRMANEQDEEVEEPTPVAVIAEQVAPLSVRAAQAIVVPQNGSYASVTHRFTWSAEIEAFYVAATDHVRKREGQTFPRPYALGLILGDYCANEAMRDPIRREVPRESQ